MSDLKSRMRNPIEAFPEFGQVAGALSKAVHNGSIPNSTIALVQLRAGQIVGSSYHTVRQTELARKSGVTDQSLASLPSWRDSPFFTDAERLALELVEAVLTPSTTGERVPDELFARVAEHYDDKALWTLTLAIGQISLFIPVGLIAKPIPGKPLGKNYSD